MGTELTQPRVRVQLCDAVKCFWHLNSREGLKENKSRIKLVVLFGARHTQEPQRICRDFSKPHKRPADNGWQCSPQILGVLKMGSLKFFPRKVPGSPRGSSWTILLLFRQGCRSRAGLKCSVPTGSTVRKLSSLFAVFYGIKRPRNK